MPRKQPTISWQQLRVVMEQWQWQDPKTGVTVTGYNPPEKAKGKRQKPFYLKYVTKKGVLEEGECICLKVTSLQRHQRMVQFVASRQIRIVCDILIVEVNGLRVVAG